MRINCIAYDHNTFYECDNDFERWIYILKNMESLKEIPYKEVNDLWADFEVVADVGSMTKDEQRIYESSLNSYRVLMSAFEKSVEDGRAEGLAEGLAEGRAEGLAEGRAEGEKKAKTDVARKMLSAGMDMRTILEITGLSEKDIEDCI